jgi:hypothetical protein
MQQFHNGTGRQTVERVVHAGGFESVRQVTQRQKLYEPESRTARVSVDPLALAESSASTFHEKSTCVRSNTHTRYACTSTTHGRMGLPTNTHLKNRVRPSAPVHSPVSSWNLQRVNRLHKQEVWIGSKRGWRNIALLGDKGPRDKYNPYLRKHTLHTRCLSLLDRLPSSCCGR